jgi:hypothetical protein
MHKGKELQIAWKSSLSTDGAKTSNHLPLAITETGVMVRAVNRAILIKTLSAIRPKLN